MAMAFHLHISEKWGAQVRAHADKGHRPKISFQGTVMLAVCDCGIEIATEVHHCYGGH